MSAEFAIQFYQVPDDAAKVEIRAHGVSPEMMEDIKCLGGFIKNSVTRFFNGVRHLLSEAEYDLYASDVVAGVHELGQQDMTAFVQKALFRFLCMDCADGASFRCGANFIQVPGPCSRWLSQEVSHQIGDELAQHFRTMLLRHVQKIALSKN